MSKNLFVSDVLAKFQSGEINKDELEDIIKELVKTDSPKRSIDSIDYNEEGITVTLDDGQTIEIGIDWEEIVLEEE